MSKFPNSYYHLTIFLEYDFERLNNTECPYENEAGKELENKDHYFYHTRLNNYGPGKVKMRK